MGQRQNTEAVASVQSRRGRPRKEPDAPKKLASTDKAALLGFDDLPGSALVSVRVIAALAGVGDACVWGWVQAGRLPQPTRIGPQTSRWRVADVRAVLAGEPARSQSEAAQ